MWITLGDRILSFQGEVVVVTIATICWFKVAAEGLSSTRRKKGLTWFGGKSVSRSSVLDYLRKLLRKSC